jgi:translocation and assembly module TamB
LKVRRALWIAVRALLGVLLSVIALGGLVLAAVWAWSGTQASLDWAWQRYAVPRGLAAQGLSGSLRTGLRARRLQAQAGGLQLQANELAIAWDPVGLLDGQLRLTGVRIGHLRVQGTAAHDGHAGAGRSPPESLALPLGVRVDHLEIERLDWTGRLPMQAGHVAAGYRYERAGGHHLFLRAASLASGRYRGELHVDDRAPLALSAWVQATVSMQAPGADDPLALAARADASGTLTDFTVHADLQPARELRGGARHLPTGPAASLKARLTPWQAPFVPRAIARLRQVDLSALWPRGPRTRLQGQVNVAPDRQGRWQLQVDLRNDWPGPWDRQHLPLYRLQGEGEWRDGQAQVRQLRVQLGEAGRDGRVEGSGRWRNPGGGHLDLRLAGVQARALHSAWQAALDGQLQARTRAGITQVEVALRGQARVGRRALDFEVAGKAVQDQPTPSAWQGRIDTASMALSDPRAGAQAWTLQLEAPIPWHQRGAAQWVLGAGQARLLPPAHQGSSYARVAWDPLQWGQGELHSSGRIHGLPLAWWPLPGRPPAGSDMVFDAQWQAHLARTLRVSAQLARVQGDITLLAETPEGTPVRVAAGVREARLALQSEGEALRLSLHWASERAGALDGELSTRLARGGRVGWHWPADAPLAGRVQARLPRIAAWSVLAPPGWRLRGSLAADITVGGTRSAPRLTGPLQADDLALRSVVDGIALESGRLRARLDHPDLVIDEWTWQTAAGRWGPAGTLRATGQAHWARAAPGQPEGLVAHLDARLDQLRASVRSDRQVTLSGTASARISPSQLSVQGELRVDRARITVTDTPAPRLGEDVRVRNFPAGVASPWAAQAAPGQRTLRLDVGIDLGRDTRVSGRGVDTDVQGQVRVTGDSFAQPRLAGMVHAVDGRYTAYGQRLDLRRAVLQFTGPHDDPALDVIAVRPDLERPVGVQITGRAKAPVLRLWSQEPATEAEKLSWLVLGRSAAAGTGETVLLEQAALSLLARRAGLGTGGLASAFGLDELTLRREGEQGAALTLGKRLGRKLYAAYEHSLSGALGTLYVFYDLSARLSLRARTGDRTGLDLIYALSFDRVGAPLAASPAPPASAGR